MTLSDLLTDADLEEIERRDAAYWTSASAEDDTGRQRAHDRRVLLAALRSERAARGRVKALAVEWDRVAGRTGERMFQGDPSADIGEDADLGNLRLRSPCRPHHPIHDNPGGLGDDCGFAVSEVIATQAYTLQVCGYHARQFTPDVRYPLTFNLARIRAWQISNIATLLTEPVR